MIDSIARDDGVSLNVGDIVIPRKPQDVDDYPGWAGAMDDFADKPFEITVISDRKSIQAMRRSAHKVRGYLIYDFQSDQYFFRIYGERDPETGRKAFTDYKLSAEDIEITIESKRLDLVEDDDGNRIDWIDHGKRTTS